MILLFRILMMLTVFTAPLPTVYQFKMEGIDGSVIDFAQFKGKKILIVNVASHCGYTPQYEGLQKLYEQHKDNLVIVGIPSNDFMWQEPGSNEDIQQFCSSTYHVTFPMAAKCKVRGWGKIPLYKWLTSKNKNGVEDSRVSWNFNKYLINERGEYVAHFSATVTPEDSMLVAEIER